MEGRSRSIFLSSGTGDGNMKLMFDGIGGDAYVNRARFLKEKALNFRKFSSMSCVHGTKIVNVDAMGPGIWEADGLFTLKEDHFLAFFPADCLGIGYTCYDKKGNPVAVGLVHAGIMGTESGIATKMIARLMNSLWEKGIKGGLIEVRMSPCIEPCCYVFKRSYLCEKGYTFVTCQAGKMDRGKDFDIPVDLRAENAFQLVTENTGDRWAVFMPREDGRESRELERNCTHCQSDGNGGYVYFSHKRSMNSGDENGNGKEPKGRNMVAIGIS